MVDRIRKQSQGEPSSSTRAASPKAAHCGEAASIRSRHDFREASELFASLYQDASDLAAAERATREEVEAVMNEPEVWRAVQVLASVLEQSCGIDPDVATKTKDQAMRGTMKDKYDSFSQLAKSETKGQDYRVCLVDRDSTTAVIAPHGGGIELGTSEVAEAIAADDFSFYAFEGIKSAGNRDLHITSTQFDEPACVALVGASLRAMDEYVDREGDE